MTEVGIRELKARLSYYLQLMQAGEEIAITARHHIVGYLSKFCPPKSGKSKEKKRSKNEFQKLMEQWKKEGYLLSVARRRFKPFKPVKMTPGPSSTEMIRQMRDEED